MLYVIDSYPGVFQGEQHLSGSGQQHLQELQGTVSNSPGWEELLLLCWNESRLQVEGTQPGHEWNQEEGWQLIPCCFLFPHLAFFSAICLCVLILVLSGSIHQTSSLEPHHHQQSQNHPDDHSPHRSGSFTQGSAVKLRTRAPSSERPSSSGG